MVRTAIVSGVSKSSDSVVVLGWIGAMEFVGGSGDVDGDVAADGAVDADGIFVEGSVDCIGGFVDGVCGFVDGDGEFGACVGGFVGSVGVSIVDGVFVDCDEVGDGSGEFVVGGVEGSVVSVIVGNSVGCNV